MQAPQSAVGTVTHEGVTTSSNYQTADEMRSDLGIEAPAESPETPEAPAADAVAEPPATPEATAQAAKPVEKERKKPAQPRIDQLTYEREEAKREAARERAARESSERKIEELRAEWRREFESLKQTRPQEKPAPTDPNADPEPDYTNTETYPDGQFDRKYLKDQARWEARQEFKEQTRVASERYQAEQRERQQYERQQAERQRITNFATKVEGVLRDQPDLRARIESVAMSRPMWDVVLESDSPHQMLAYMADHPEEAERINGLPPLHAFKAMSRLEYELDQAAAVTGSAPAKPKTSAHPPVSPVSGSHSAPASGEPGEDAPYEEWAAYHNQKEREAARGRR